MGKNYHNRSKVWKSPKRPYEKERLDAELQIVGKYGLRNKTEVWRTNFILSHLRSVARHLLTLPEKDTKRLFEGQAILRRLTRLGILGEQEQKLDHVLGLTLAKFLDRRLQSRVVMQGLAKSQHHARVMIRQRHIRVGKRMVNVPSFLVRLDSEKHIEFSSTSPLGGARAGRVKRKGQKAGKKEAAADASAEAQPEEDL